MEAQKFMNLHGLTECFECDGVFFKHKENAEDRSKTSGKPMQPHAISAGPVTKKEADENNLQ